MIAKDIISLNQSGITRKLDENKVIHVSDPSIKYVYLLQKGVIKISIIKNNHKEIIKFIIKSGNLFGELNLLDHSEDTHEIAVAMESCEVLCIPADTVKTLMANNNVLRKSIHHYISNRIKKTEERLFSLMMNGVKDRILEFLKEFVKEFGQPFNGGYRVRNFLTHEDIANITTTSRQSVTSTLMDFKKKGWIDYDSRNLSVFNL
jgi:CRP/FNR family transcriptional regulator